MINKNYVYARPIRSKDENGEAHREFGPILDPVD